MAALSALVAPEAFCAVSSSELADLSLEQLANIVVTSVSRREESLAGAPASIYVITAEEIRRSRATSLPEALRLAPNLDIARADVNQYAISARGFDNVLANKMLVLIDGRTVYTPLFSGVFWEAQDVLLEDIERIEVISGPGATLWGANAVNGVINVITRSAHDTQGPLAVGILGTEQSGAAVRYGGALAGSGGHYRLYAKYDDRQASEFASGASVHDASTHAQSGFRADWQGPAQTFTFQGDAYFGHIDQPSSIRKHFRGQRAGALDPRSRRRRNLRIQAYYDNTRRASAELSARCSTPSTSRRNTGSCPARSQDAARRGLSHARDRRAQQRCPGVHARATQPDVGDMPSCRTRSRSRRGST